MPRPVNLLAYSAIAIRRPGWFVIVVMMCVRLGCCREMLRACCSTGGSIFATRRWGTGGTVSARCTLPAFDASGADEGVLQVANRCRDEMYGKAELV